MILEGGIGQHSKYPPYAFTEQGVAMLSSVLRRPRAIQVNIAMIRTFVKLRQMLPLMRSSPGNWRRWRRSDVQFEAVFDAIRELMQPQDRPRRRIGFRVAGAQN